MNEQKRRKITIYHFFNIPNLIVFIICLVLGGLFFVIYPLLNYEGFTIYNMMNGSFVSGACLIGFSLLYIAGNFGTFDVISVGFANLFSVIKKNGTKKYDGIYGYEEVHREKRLANRFKFFPILVAGIIYLIVSLILYFIWHSTFIA